jgi:hypothetical protein
MLAGAPRRLNIDSLETFHSVFGPVGVIGHRESHL